MSAQIYKEYICKVISITDFNNGFDEICKYKLTELNKLYSYKGASLSSGDYAVLYITRDYNLFARVEKTEKS